MAKKQQYRIRNWKEYNKALVNRGSLTVWFDKNSIDAWNETIRAGKRGRPHEYSDLAIQCCLTIRAVFRLPLRSTEGFVRSLMELLQLPLKTQDHWLLSIRQRTLSLTLPNGRAPSGPMHLLVDSTGLKVYGEGEWKVRKHGWDKRRTWGKIPLFIN